jgi:hypothetical protein
MSVHALALTRELVTLTETCAERGIEAMPYKGPVLAQLFYEDLGQRGYRDGDLLVHASDVPAVLELLRERGWESRDGAEQMPTAALLREDCELHFERAPGLELELHWQLLPLQHSRGVDADTLWQRSLPLLLAGSSMRTFSVEDWLVLLCLHGGDKHRWSRLQMIMDVARLLGLHPGLDWDRVFTLARTIGRESSLLLGLLMAWYVLEAPLPDRILTQVAASKRRCARAALLSDRPFELDVHQPTCATWRAATLDMRRRLQGANVEAAPPASPGRYLLAALEPDWSDRQALSLPRGLSALYWLIRPARLIGRHGIGLARRIGISSPG